MGRLRSVLSEWVGEVAQREGHISPHPRSHRQTWNKGLPVPKSVSVQVILARRMSASLVSSTGSLRRGTTSVIHLTVTVHLHLQELECDPPEVNIPVLLHFIFIIIVR